MKKVDLKNFLSPIKKNFLQVIITTGAASLAAIHLFVPGIKIDTIGLTLIFAAFLPWLIPYLPRFLESGKIGGWELKFKDLENKVQKQNTEIEKLSKLLPLKTLKYELEAFNPDAPINQMQDNFRQAGLKQNPFLVYIKPKILQIVNSAETAKSFDNNTHENIERIISNPKCTIKTVIDLLDQIILNLQ